MLTLWDHVCAFGYAVAMTSLIALVVPGILLSVVFFWYTVLRLF